MTEERKVIKVQLAVKAAQGRSEKLEIVAPLVLMENQVRWVRLVHEAYKDLQGPKGQWEKLAIQVHRVRRVP